MEIGAEQYQKLVDVAYGGTPAGTDEPMGGAAYRDAYSAQPLTPADAELVIAITQILVDADNHNDRVEEKLLDSIAGHVYGHANVRTAVPVLAPVDNDDLRMDLLQTHAAQLKGKPAAALAFAFAYAVSISDLHFAPEESALLEALREALGLDEDRAGEIALIVGEALTPPE